jgi:hypothetical protein
MIAMSRLNEKGLHKHSDLLKECASNTSDPFWKDIFSQAVYGRFPKGFILRDGILMYRFKSKQYKIKLPDNVESLAALIMKFMQQTRNILSIQDKLNIQESAIEKSKNEESPSNNMNNWKKIKLVKLQDLLKTIYIDRQTEELNLSSQEKQQLKEILHLGIFLKAFTDIQLKDGLIEHVIGLEWDAENRKFFLGKIVKKNKSVYQKRPPHPNDIDSVLVLSPNKNINNITAPNKKQKTKRNDILNDLFVKNGCNLDDVKTSYFIDLWVKFLNEKNKHNKTKTYQEKLEFDLDTDKSAVPTPAA